MKYRFVLDQLLQLSPRPINRIHIIGGGVRNRLLCQLTANATGLPVIAGPAEATAVGNIMVQALSADCVSSLSEMRSIIGGSFELEKYVPRQVDEWNKAYNRFREIIEQ
jgi:rhamnulokinase